MLANQTKTKLRQSVFTGNLAEQVNALNAPTSPAMAVQKSDKALNIMNLSPSAEFGEDYKHDIKGTAISPLKKVNKMKKEKERRE